MSGREEIASRKAALLALCHEHKVARLQVFGSVLRDDFNPVTSDIDFLVDFLPGSEKPWMGEYLDLKEALEGLFSRKVDLISSVDGK